MINDKEMLIRKALLSGLVQFANDRLEKLRKEWEAADSYAAWFVSQTPEDQEFLRAMNINPS